MKPRLVEARCMRPGAAAIPSTVLSSFPMIAAESASDLGSTPSASTNMRATGDMRVVARPAPYGGESVSTAREEAAGGNRQATTGAPDVWSDSANHKGQRLQRASADGCLAARSGAWGSAATESPIPFRAPLPLSQWQELADRLRRIRLLRDVEVACEWAMAGVVWMLLAEVLR